MTQYQLLPDNSVRVSGDLLARLMRNYDRMEGSDYSPENCYVLHQSWPGDYVGRTVLALACLQRATGRKPVYMEEIMDRLPAHLNAKGFMGPDQPLIDEQQLSGHGWLVSGLVEYSRVTGNPRGNQMADRMTRGLFLPLQGKMASYPTKPEVRSFDGSYGGNIANDFNGWALSTDIVCAFISLEGLVRVARMTGDSQMHALIAEMRGVFDTIDLEAVSAQLHSSLTAARMFLEQYETTGDDRYLATARSAYDLFRARGVTENFANYNWFGRPTWTEPCAIVDSLGLALDLWRNTGEARYLDDAHSIHFNAMGYAQKPHGGFGCDNCIGAESTIIENKVYDTVWCCNMRGASGLTYAYDYTYLRAADAVAVPMYFDSTAKIDFGGKGQNAETWTLQQTTEYPLVGKVTFVTEESTLRTPKELRLFVPTWADDSQLKVSVNGKPVTAPIVKSFASVKGLWKAGDRIEVEFPITLRIEPILNPLNLPGHHTYRHGPLMLGVPEFFASRDRSNLQMTEPGKYQGSGKHPAYFGPINDVMYLEEATVKSDRRKLLFR